MIQNRKRVQDLSAKSYGLHALLYFIFRCRGYTYNEYLNVYVDNPRVNDLIAENILSYIYTIDFSALKIKCVNKVSNFDY